MVPALTFLNLSPTQAASTSLIAVMSTSVSSTIEYARQKRIDYALGLAMAACAIPGGVLGAVLSEYLLEDTFKLYFGILLILTGLYILYKNSVLKDHRVNRRSLAFAGCSVYCFIWRWDNIKSFWCGRRDRICTNYAACSWLDNAQSGANLTIDVNDDSYCWSFYTFGFGTS